MESQPAERFEETGSNHDLIWGRETSSVCSSHNIKPKKSRYTQLLYIQKRQTLEGKKCVCTLIFGKWLLFA